MRRLSAVSAALVLGLVAAACGGDQGAGQQGAETATEQAEQSGAQVQVSDAELRSFVRASMELEDFRSEMQTRMSEAADQEEGRKVRQELMQERDSIVRAAGLDGTERYNSIMKAVKASDRVQERYTSIRQQMASDTAP